MTHFDPLHPLSSSIIEILAANRDLSIDQLQQKLKEDFGVSTSRQNLYRTVSLFIEKQVLVRNSSKLALNMVWASHLVDFGKTIQETYREAESEDLVLPQEDNTSRAYLADSLLALDPIWNDGLLRLAQLSSSKEWYVYNSHPWYSLGMQETEFRLYKTLVSSGIRCHMLYGNNTFLDQYGRKKIAVDGFDTAIALSPPLPPSLRKDGHAIWACDDYIVECVMPPAVAKHFSFFFENVNDISDFDPQLFSDIFRMKARCKISFYKNTRDAERLRRMLMPYF